MILLPISPTGAVSSGMVAEVSHAVTSGSNTYLEFGGESNEPKVIPEGTSGTSGLVVEAVNVGRWGAEQNARFKELAHDEALRELSIEELAELESLTRLRRFARYPRSADEIIWERRQQRLTRGLVQALQAYVEFHETPRST